MPTIKRKIRRASVPYAELRKLLIAAGAEDIPDLAIGTENPRSANPSLQIFIKPNMTLGCMYDVEEETEGPEDQGFDESAVVHNVHEVDPETVRGFLVEYIKGLDAEETKKKSFRFGLTKDYSLTVHWEDESEVSTEENKPGGVELGGVVTTQ